MRDEQIKELISAYLDGELSVDERTLVERHLANSVECQQFLDQLRQQRVALQSVPRRKLQVDLSQRVLQAIEQARPVPHHHAGTPTTAAPSESVAKRTWLRTWQGLALGAGTAAAAIAVVMYLTSVDRKSNEGLVDTLVALNQFQQVVQYVVIYDISVTPQAKANRVVEGLMTKAGIPINKGIAIDRKLSKEILDSRFVGGGKAEKGKPDIEMLFVRGTIQQLDAVETASKSQPNSGVKIGLDLASAPKDLHIFLQLNKATGLDVAEMKANPRSLRSPAAFPLQLQGPLPSAGSQLAAADLNFLMKQAEQGNVTSAEVLDPDQPGQAIFIIREVADPPK